MATEAERVLLRKFLGDLPVAGADPFFTDPELDDLIAEFSTLELAAAKGWRIKAASYAELVDTAEGTSKRAMSDLHKNALAMVTSFDPPTVGGSGSSGRTRSHPIVRR